MRDECALLLDGYLRRLARQEALGRDVLGSLARAFLGQRGQHALGFARVRDYARERLGLSARELQSLAHVSARLAELPEVAAAFAHGELSWTQVRLLVRVATAERRAAWVEVARGRTVRALEATIAHDTGRPVERDDTLDEEPRVQVRLRCPRRVRERWHAVTVLARAVAGEELAPWQVADAVAAEGFSARDLEPEDPMAGLPGPECDPPPPERIDPGETPAVFGCLDWSALDEALPADLERLRDGAADVNAFALDGRMDHHLLFRSRGGGNARANRITVCAWHHLRGIHQGRVRAWGTAPDDVTWELGVRPGCAPLLRLHGDEYLVERA